MDKLLKLYQTFFFVLMDEESLDTFQLPVVLDPTEQPANFNQICFIFLLPFD